MNEEIELMCDIEEMVKKLKSRAGMYIGKENTNTEELYTFLNGFYVGKSTSEIITELDIVFYRSFSHYVYDWLKKNNRLKQEEFSFCWYKFLDVFEDSISLFYLIGESFFHEYHSNSLDEKYYVRSEKSENNF